MLNWEAVRAIAHSLERRKLEMRPRVGVKEQHLSVSIDLLELLIIGDP